MLNRLTQVNISTRKIKFDKCKRPKEGGAIFMPPALLVTADSFLPLSLFCKEPIHNFHIVMHLLGSMNLFSDFAAVLKGL